MIAAGSLTVTACEGDAAANASVAADVAHAAGNILGSLAEAAENSSAGNSGGQGNKTSAEMTGNASTTGEFRLSDIPEYTDSPYVAVNGNVPYFTEDDLTDVSFERYSDLDSLGRCGGWKIAVDGMRVGGMLAGCGERERKESDHGYEIP